MYNPFKPTYDGVWWRNDNDGTWDNYGPDEGALRDALRELEEDGWSHDQEIWIVAQGKKFFVACGGNPPEPHTMEEALRLLSL